MSDEPNISSTRTGRPKRKLIAIVAIALAVTLVAVFAVGYLLGWFNSIVYGYNARTYSIRTIANEQLSIHFIQLDNGANGESIYIKAGDTDVLIDAGSTPTSAKRISNYVNRYCSDGRLEYVIVTHADADHIAGFVGTTVAKGIFDSYECETIIQFARTNQDSDIYKDYCAKRDAEVVAGAKAYTALDCYNNTKGAQRTYQLAEGITLTILYQEYYETFTSNENDYSVCVLISQQYQVGDTTETNHYIFTGDLEQAGEQSLVKYNPNLPQVVLYKASHHGSSTSANEPLLNVINPQIVCVSCVAGSIEYTTNMSNTFPTQQFINRIANYTDRVYVTDVAKLALNNKTGYYNVVGTSPLNGDIVCACTNGEVTMYFSHNDTKLKDTDWFRDNRTPPTAWAN